MLKLLLKIGFEPDFAEVLISTIKIFFTIFIVLQFIWGIAVANDSNKCKVNSFFDVLTMPSYALGCNLGKNRFEFKLN